MNLISFLTTTFLDETIGGLRSPQESDLRLQQLESLLMEPEKNIKSSPSPEENRLLQAYLDLSVEDLASLSPEVNEWFLERLAFRASAHNQWERKDVGQRIARLFFLAERGMQQYLAVGALLAMDEHTERPEASSVAFVWENIWNDEGLTNAAKNDSISNVADILLDQHYFCDQSQYPSQALVQLLRSEKQFAAYLVPQLRPVRSRIVDRIQLLGESDDSELGRLLYDK